MFSSLFLPLSCSAPRKEDGCGCLPDQITENVPVSSSSQLTVSDIYDELNSFSATICRDMFGEECVDFKDKNCLAVSVDEKTAFINLETRVSIRLCEVYTPKFYGNWNIGNLMFVFRPWSMRKLILKMILSEKWWSSLCRGCMKPWTLSCEIADSRLPTIRLLLSLKNFCYYSPSNLNYLNQTEDTRCWTGQSTSKDWIAFKIEWIPVKDGCWYVCAFRSHCFLVPLVKYTLCSDCFVVFFFFTWHFMFN